MAKFFIMYGLEFIIGLILVTQVLIPVFLTNLKFFWFFRPTPQATTELEKLKEQAEKNSEERKNISGAVSTIEEVLKETKNHIK